MSPRLHALLALALALAAVAVVPLAQAAPASSGKLGDPALAKRILTRIADYPGGWTVNAGSKPSDSGCFSKPENAHSPTARAQASPDFINNAGGERSGASVALFPSPSGARAALHAVSAASPIACYRTTISNVLKASGITVTSSSRVPLAIQPLGDAMTAMRLTFNVRKGTNRAALVVDLIFAQRRRALVSLGFNAQSSLPSIYDERATAAKAVARVPA